MSVESLVIIFIALAAGSLVKGISGLGLPLTAIPVMAGYMEVDRAVAIMVLPGVILNFWLLWTYRAHAVRIANLPAVTVVAVLSVALGAWVLSEAPETYLLIFLCLWLGLYLLRVLLKLWVDLPLGKNRLTQFIAVSAAGLVQGSIGMAGPILAPYLHSLDLKQPQYVFAVS
ncbi:MAG: TSUP family transporter [Proteobacteria bacterium]|nr:TSUP family transporter [Pseudomonadota bacterium]